jgi:hypothetical protein
MVDHTDAHVAVEARTNVFDKVSADDVERLAQKIGKREQTEDLDRYQVGAAAADDIDEVS